MDDLRYEHHLKHRGRANRRVAEVYWGVVGVVVVALSARRALGWWQRRYQVHGILSSQTWLGVQLPRSTALCSAISMISLPYRNMFLGRFVALTAYTSIIVVTLLSVDAPIFTEHFTDDIAFRAAWTTISQIPLVYLLSAKRGPFSYLTGLDYTRINWLHRCVARMLLVSATVHMGAMLSSISLTALIGSHDQAMKIVRYGIGAYAMLIWIALSSLAGVRRTKYTVFHINHWISTMVFLGIVIKHVPSYARIPIYASIALVATDKSLVALRYMWCNISIRTERRKFMSGRLHEGKSKEFQTLGMGHAMKMVAPIVTGSSATTTESTTVVRIVDLPFKWRPGQHIRMWIPSIGKFEVHPFTPATCSPLADSPAHDGQEVEEHGLLPRLEDVQANNMTLMIQAKDGLTRRLAEYHDKWRSLPCPNASQPSTSLVAYVDGPYGTAPTWEEYENIVMVSASTGVSFMLSIIHYLSQLYTTNEARLRTRRLHLVWANRHIEPLFEATVTDLLSKHGKILRERGVQLEADFYTSCPMSMSQAGPDHNIDPFAHLRSWKPRRLVGRPLLRIRNPNLPDDIHEEDEDVEWSPVEHSPIMSYVSSRTSEETYEEEDRHSFSDLDSDLGSIDEELETSCWTRFKLPRLKSLADTATKSCQCALLRHQEVKCGVVGFQDLISRHNNQRPEIEAILQSKIPLSYLESTMVAVCGGNVGDATRRAVSAMNFDYARGRRKVKVELHMEGIS